ncbi:MAG: hypothetical protein JWQ21_2576, partial [Herminiimonas sp.]|nr:hypothetical protein [Herminiimonas sp.]
MTALQTHPELAQYAPLFARIALANIRQEYPNKLDHVMHSANDVRSPQELHPVFYGSYDWHSAVHMHWLLVRLLRLFPAMPEAVQIRQTLDAHFTGSNIAVEVAYLRQPSSGSFERTYGWAWLLKLQTELIESAKAGTDAAAWRNALQPLADVFAERYLQFLPLSQFPIRSGTHANSAFGLLFALDYAECIRHIALQKLIAAKADAWFGRDRRYPAAYEPGGDDFLSGGLIEAALMLRVIGGGYADWWHAFCPAPQGLQTWLSPVQVTDRSDARLVHLEGLNLSRTWCWKMLADELPAALRAPVSAAIHAHLAASLPHAATGKYVGT